MTIYYAAMKMTNHSSARRSWTWGVLSAAVLLGGCQDPNYQTEQALRDQHIRELLEASTHREQESPANLEELWQRIEAGELRRAERLDQTLLLVKEVHLEDQREWSEQAPVRREKVRSIFAGHPENIPPTWRKMAH